MYIVAHSLYLLIALYMCALLDGYIDHSKDLISVFFPSDVSSNPPPLPLLLFESMIVVWSD